MGYKGSTNPKAQAARDKKAGQKADNKAAKIKTLEDAYWADPGDKNMQAKAARAEDREAKKLAELEKKKELKELLAKEEEGLQGPSSNKMRKAQSSSGPKKTKAQIARMQALEQISRDEERERQRL